LTPFLGVSILFLSNKKGEIMKIETLAALNSAINEIEEIKKVFGIEPQPEYSGGQDHFFEIGKNYLIRTVTMIVTGKLERVGNKELLLSNAAWIADTGRFFDNLKSEQFEEVEPFINDVILGRGSIVDMTQINKLPESQK